MKTPAIRITPSLVASVMLQMPGTSMQAALPVLMPSVERMPIHFKGLAGKEVYVQTINGLY
jgi:hypothetical protein